MQKWILGLFLLVMTIPAWAQSYACKTYDSHWKIYEPNMKVAQVVIMACGTGCWTYVFNSTGKKYLQHRTWSVLSPSISIAQLMGNGNVTVRSEACQDPVTKKNYNKRFTIAVPYINSNTYYTKGCCAEVNQPY